MAPFIFCHGGEVYFFCAVVSVRDFASREFCKHHVASCAIQIVGGCVEAGMGPCWLWAPIILFFFCDCGEIGFDLRVGLT